MKALDQGSGIANLAADKNKKMRSLRWSVYSCYFLQISPLIGLSVLLSEELTFNHVMFFALTLLSPILSGKVLDKLRIELMGVLEKEADAGLRTETNSARFQPCDDRRPS